MNELISRGKRIDAAFAGRLLMLAAGVLFALVLLVTSVYSEKKMLPAQYETETKRGTEAGTDKNSLADEPSGVTETLSAQTDAVREPALPAATGYTAATEIAAGETNVPAVPTVPAVAAPMASDVVVPVLPNVPAIDSKEESSIGKAEHENMHLNGSPEEFEAEIMIPETEVTVPEADVTVPETDGVTDVPAVVPEDSPSGETGAVPEEPPVLMTTAQGFVYDSEGMIVSCPASSCVDGLLALPSDAACRGIRSGALDGIGCDLTDVYIPENINVIEPGTFGRFDVFWFEVDPGNPVYMSVDGMLYFRDGTAF